MSGAGSNPVPTRYDLTQEADVVQVAGSGDRQPPGSQIGNSDGRRRGRQVATQLAADGLPPHTEHVVLAHFGQWPVSREIVRQF